MGLLSQSFDVALSLLFYLFIYLFIYLIFLCRAAPVAHGGLIWAAAAGHSPQQRQQFGIQGACVTYTIAQRNAGSLTHWARSGMEPASSWILVGFITGEPWRELPVFALFKDLIKGFKIIPWDSSLDHTSLRVLWIWTLPRNYLLNFDAFNTWTDWEWKPVLSFNTDVLPPLYVTIHSFAHPCPLTFLS